MVEGKYVVMKVTKTRVLKKNIAAYLRSHKIVIEYMGSS